MKTYLVVFAILFSGCGLSSADFRYLYDIMGMYTTDVKVMYTIVNISK